MGFPNSSVGLPDDPSKLIPSSINLPGITRTFLIPFAIGRGLTAG